MLACRALRCSAAARALTTTASRDPSHAARPKPQKNAFQGLGMSLDAEAHSELVVIDALGPSSFTIGGVLVAGSVLLLPHLATLWNVDKHEHITPEAFALIKLHYPRPDLLVLGTGPTVQRVDPAVNAFFRDIGVRLDVYDTKNAAHAFNVLNSEGRRVAAALIPAGNSVLR